MSAAPLDPNRNLLAARVLWEELGRWGVQHVALSPGSRSAPLALAAHRAEGLVVSVHTDERCGAFFALGLARASGRPVALVCTSGTAGAHYLPALLEADAAGVPLVVLTADRPPDLLDCGAPQTLAQHGMFGGAVRFAQSLPSPEPTGRWLRWLRARVGRAMEAATGSPPGPVHLNVCFDEPLSEVLVPGDVPASLPSDDPLGFFGRPGRPFAGILRGEPNRPGLGEEAAQAERPVVVAGPESPAAAWDWAERLGAPLLADPLSGLRRAGAISGYDALLRDAAAQEALAPDLVLHFGRTPTCKHIGAWLERHLGLRRLVFDPDGRREDPNHLGSTFVRGSSSPPAGTPAPSPWLGLWRRLDAQVSAARREATGPLGFEGTLIDALSRVLPDGAQLLVASSMPVRQLDAFWAGGPLRVLANRGVNGIDGLVSTAFGAAAHAPTWAVLGDLALLHDLGGLAAAPRLGLAPVLVVINNGGGGIFSYLPLAATSAATDGGAFSPLFTTPHQTDFAHAAALFSLDYARPASVEELESALLPGPRARLVELVVDREDSVARHRRFWADVRARVLPLLPEVP